MSNDESMMEKLENVLKELPALLEIPERWDSLVINRRKPFTYRVLSLVEGFRISLHKFDACDRSESFYHPHPWPDAFKILSGAYQMQMGRSVSRFSDPLDAGSFRLYSGSMYAITDPYVWHQITPIMETHTVMVNDPPWDIDVAHTKTRTTVGKDLDKLPLDELVGHLNKFQELIRK